MLPPPLPPDESRRLQALRNLCVLDSPAEERFDRIVRAAARLFGVPIALVSLLDEGRQWFKARVGLSASETPRDVSFRGHAILSPGAFVVPDAFRARVFQKFAQADGSDSRGRVGTGLGLRIARALVERLGGTLDYVTARDAGTTFWFDLPECPPDSPPNSV